MKVDVYLNGKSKDPASLNDGNVLLVCACLKTVVPLAEQAETDALKIECVLNALTAQFPAATVTNTAGPDPVQYKYVIDPVTGDIERVCCLMGILQVQFSTASVVKVEIEVGMPIASSVAPVTP